MKLIDLPRETYRMPVVTLFAVQRAGGRWLVCFDEDDDRVSLLLFTSESSAVRYMNSCPDLRDLPGYSLVALCHSRSQLLHVARRARARGVHAFQVDRLPTGDCWFDLDLEHLIAEG